MSATGNQPWGRSPLTRGRHEHGLVRAAPSGSIPAHAGETTAPRPRPAAPAVDPRSRGGDPGWLQALVAEGGRSPLTRGRLVGCIPGGLLPGSIPAHAGETALLAGPLNLAAVDPRSRGGDAAVTENGWALKGRSPLTRGRLPTSFSPVAFSRSIPAHAGETWRARCWRLSPGVDPRSRGGDTSWPCASRMASGRSPLTRGRRASDGSRPDHTGSIPAHAGETPRVLQAAGEPEVDPRSRGGDMGGCWRGMIT